MARQQKPEPGGFAAPPADGGLSIDRLAQAFAATLPDDLDGAIVNVTDVKTAEAILHECARFVGDVVAPLIRDLGAALAMPLVAWMIGQIGWRPTFLILGGIGFVWAFVWYAWFRDEPSEHSTISEAERELILNGRQSAGHAG